MLTKTPHVRKPLGPLLRGLLRHGRGGLAATATVLAILGLILRITIRDQYWPVAFFFYGTPPAVQAGLWLLAAACYDWRTRRRSVIAAIALAGLSAVWTYRTMWYDAAPVEARPETIRIATWNAGRGLLGWQAAVRDARALDADIVCLTEAGLGTRPQRALWEAAFPDYAHSRIFRGTLILSRYPLEPLETGWARKDIAHQVVRVRTEQGPLVVTVVDIHSNPLRWRRGAFERIDQILARYADQPLVIAGDFNTPPESIWFDTLRPRLRSAFEAGGSGYAATWPQPLPILAIDQIWLSPRVDPQTCRARGMWASDHRAIITEVSLQRPPPNEPDQAAPTP